MPPSFAWDLNTSSFTLKGIVGDEQIGGAIKKGFYLERRGVTVPDAIAYDVHIAN